MIFNRPTYGFTNELDMRTNRSSIIIALATSLTIWFCDRASGQQCLLGSGERSLFSEGLPSSDFLQSPSEVRRRHNGPTGKPCITVEGNSNSEKVNPKIFEHWVSAANVCGLQ